MDATAEFCASLMGIAASVRRETDTTTLTSPGQSFLPAHTHEEWQGTWSAPK